MKNSRIFFFALFLLLNTGTVFCQSDWIEMHADKRVEEINAELVSVDKNSALSDSQKVQLRALLIENFKAIRAINKEAEESQKKELIAQKRKELWAEIHKDIFTKEQKAARKAAKKE